MPDRFIPLTPGSDMNQVLAILNKNFGELDSEGTTKAYRGANGKIAVIEGKLPYSGGFGSLYYDQNNNSRILIGIAPDGEIDIAASKPGFNITEQYS